MLRTVLLHGKSIVVWSVLSYNPHSYRTGGFYHTIYLCATGGFWLGRHYRRPVDVAEDNLPVDLPHPLPARAAGRIQQQHLKVEKHTHL